jgi:hypothetical protein
MIRNDVFRLYRQTIRITLLCSLHVLEHLCLDALATAECAAIPPLPAPCLGVIKARE